MISRVVATMLYPFIHKHGSAAHQETIYISIYRFIKCSCKLSNKFRSSTMIGIKIKDPAGSYRKIIKSPVSLNAVVFEGVMENVGCVLITNFEGFIGRPGINNKYVNIQRHEAFHTCPDVALLVIS